LYVAEEAIQVWREPLLLFQVSCALADNAEAGFQGSLQGPGYPAVFFDLHKLQCLNLFTIFAGTGGMLIAIWNRREFTDAENVSDIDTLTPSPTRSIWEYYDQQHHRRILQEV
jgi:hypothetical protein